MSEMNYEVNHEQNGIELPEIYKKELLRNSLRSMNSPCTEEEVGRYRNWKVRNEVNSKNLVSSLGRALQNRGEIFTQNSEEEQIVEHIDHTSPYSADSGFNQSILSRSLNEERVCQKIVSPPFQGKGHTRSEEQGSLSPQMHYQNIYHPVTPSGVYNHNHWKDIHPPHVANYLRPPPPSHCYPPAKKIPHCCKETSGCHCCSPSGHAPVHHHSEPTKAKQSKSKTSDKSIKNLYRILWLQNEQLGLLERQVSKLIELNSAKEPQVALNTLDSTKVPQTLQSKPDTTEKATKVEFQNVGVNTSFSLLCSKCSKDMDEQAEPEPEIASRLPVDESLTFQGVNIPVVEYNNSPPASLHIDMQEYQRSSSSEMDESDTSDEDESVGWTFYNNVVGQVNNILKMNEGRGNMAVRDESEVVRQATLDQLKRLGVSVPEASLLAPPKKVTFEKGLWAQQKSLKAESDTSMRINALASKYLTSAGVTGGKLQDISMCNIVSGNTNMSLATMRYLERYHLVNNGVEPISHKPERMRQRKKYRSKENPPSKILDITTIKQQPKLLPKKI